MKIITDDNQVIEVKDEIVQELIIKTSKRASFGFSKYKTTLKDNNVDDFLEHCIQEVDDLYKYLMKIKEDYNLVPKIVELDVPSLEPILEPYPSYNPFPGYLQQYGPPIPNEMTRPTCNPNRLSMEALLKSQKEVYDEQKLEKPY